MEYVIKEAGHTIIQTIDKFKKANSNIININEKVCYCGRLDPMARGLVLLLVGNECKKMEDFLGTIKEYEFEILFGLSTDTDDPMGIINNVYNYSNEDVLYYLQKIKEFIKIGKFQQNFHNYSSKRVDGKPLWTYNNYDTIIIPSHEVEIFTVEYKDIKKYDFIEWKNNIIEIINKIDKKNNFRQEQIINIYNNININHIYSIPIKINVSSGFYVRQLVADIKKAFNICILTFDINRTNIINLKNKAY